MKNKKTKVKEWQESSGNVFDDLDLPDAASRLAKAKLALQINLLLKQKKLKQKEAAELLGVDQAKISLLNRGRLSAFSIERLIKYLNILECDVDIVIRKIKHAKHVGELHVIQG